MKCLPLCAVFLALSAAPAFAAASVAVTINDVPYTGPSNPRGVKLIAGTPFSVDIAIKGGKSVDPIWLKHGEDIQMNGASNDSKPDADTYTFYLIPMHAGPLVLPGLDIPMKGGPALHMAPIRLVAVAK